VFTGIIKYQGKLVSLELGKLKVESELFSTDSALELGCSIAVSGACLSLTDWSTESRTGSFDLLEETQNKTAFRALTPGSSLNLETSLLVGDGLDGHFVTGHVDAVSEVKSVEQLDKNSREIWCELPKSLASLVAPKGSITINGVSLTVGQVLEDRFSVYLIPLTWEGTNLGELEPGSLVNLEADILARYVERISTLKS